MYLPIMKTEEKCIHDKQSQALVLLWVTDGILREREGKKPVLKPIASCQYKNQDKSKIGFPNYDKLTFS